MRQFIEQNHRVIAIAPTAAPGDGDYVSLKNWDKLVIGIQIRNATTVTGVTVVLNQATDVAGTGEKSLGFVLQHVNADTDATDTLVATAVTSDTFTSDATDNKKSLHIVEVDAETLDVNNDFDCVQVALSGSANSTVSVDYTLVRGRYTSGGDTPASSAITD